MSKRFLAFFDMDGTLIGNFDHESKTGHSLWSQLAERLGDDVLDKKREINDAWYNDEILSYNKWADKTISLYQQEGLTEEQFYSVVESTEYNDGVKETFSQFHDLDITTVILTGGFRAQADRIKKELEVDHVVAACETEWSNGELIDFNAVPLDAHGKKQMMDMYVNSYKSDVATSFVGDGSNDVHAIKNADLGIGFRGHPEVKEHCDHHYEDFNQVTERIIEEYHERIESDL